ncbi:unnamed protein product, partial [marine sediment metagenome]
MPAKKKATKKKVVKKKAAKKRSKKSALANRPPDQGTHAAIEHDDAAR